MSQNQPPIKPVQTSDYIYWRSYRFYLRSSAGMSITLDYYRELHNFVTNIITVLFSLTLGPSPGGREKGGDEGKNVAQICKSQQFATHNRKFFAIGTRAANLSNAQIVSGRIIVTKFEISCDFNEHENRHKKADQQQTEKQSVQCSKLRSPRLQRTPAAQEFFFF